MSFSSESQIADYTFANEHGIKRREGVFSVVDALEVDTSAGQYDGAKTVTVSLKFPTDVTKGSERMKTQTLIRPSTFAHELIPGGSRIVNYSVAVNGNAVLDSKLALYLGFSCPAIKGKEGKKALASRISGPQTPLTGDFLNYHKVASYPALLNKDCVVPLNKIYADDAETQGEDPVALPDYKLVADGARY